jgi:hypothetical protein
LAPFVAAEIAPVADAGSEDQVPTCETPELAAMPFLSPVSREEVLFLDDQTHVSLPDLLAT